MSEFLVNLLPTEARQVSALPQRRRALWLSVGLIGSLTFGLTAHSFVSARRATAERDVALALRESAQQIDDLRDGLVSERDMLANTVAVHQAVALAVEPSDVVATISHLIPQDITLESLQLHPVEQKAPPKSTKSRSKSKPAPAVVTHPAAVECTINGLAPDDRTVQSFADALAATPPFTDVSITEQRVSSADNGHRFTLTFTADPYAALRNGPSQVARSTR